MVRELTRGAVLVVVMNRDERRMLFELLDGYEFDAIYTAKDFAQARALLRQDNRLDCVLLEFSGDGSEAIALCEMLGANDQPPPVIGMASTDALRERWLWEAAPDVVVDWLRTPLVVEEAVWRLQSALAHGRAPVAALPASVDGIRDARWAFEDSPDELLLWDPADGRIVEVNAAFAQRSGVAPTTLVGRSVESFDCGPVQVSREELLVRLQRDGSVRYQTIKQTADGSRHGADAHTRIVRHGSRVLALTAYRDSATTAGHERALHAAAEIGRFGGVEIVDEVVAAVRAWLEPDAIWVVARRAEAGADAQVLHGGDGRSVPPRVWNDVFKLLRSGDPLVIPADAESVLAHSPALVQLSGAAFAALPIVDERLDQVGALVLCSARPWSDVPGLRDVLEMAAARIGLHLELVRAREQGRAQGLLDSHTGLPNRLLFNDRLDTTIKEAHRTGEMFAVLFVDLDRFKTINDSLGHGVGDEVLLAVAQRLRASVRGSDTVARYAGDEFTLILRHIVQREDVLRVADKICRVLEAPLTLRDGRELHITASIGISFYPDDAASADKLLQHADVAMYSAKGMGRNTYQTYVAVPEESHQQRLALEAKLRQAERNNELRVYYQPQVSAASEDIVGMEALIRWEHPELGMISPGFFIPLAEETGLIVPIGAWVLRQALADTYRINLRFGLQLRVSVNLSALQLRQPDLVEVVAAALREADVEARLLELEVTESINVKSIPNLLETLGALREMGCSIAIDDFGTGQSSLDYIRRFPADRIKVDQVFVRNIGVDPDDEAIVRATIDMAHNLGRHVVAEGVEYEEHREFLHEHGCEELQGYLFCRPLPVASFENLLAERERLLGAS
jgi:diguanylate cyclase (GGDEF)-like protein/PAS domain S-box-containing protein